MSYAAVWLNGRFVGGWPYGYTSFQLDLTPFVRIGADNVLAIRLNTPTDASRDTRVPGSTETFGCSKLLPFTGFVSMATLGRLASP